MKRFVILFIFIVGVMACNNTEPSAIPKQNIPLAPKLEKQKKSIIVPLKAKAPDYDTTQWTELKSLDTSIQILMKYATTDNFVKEKMYNCSRCFLRPEVAVEIVKIQAELKTKGYGLKMLDCYRPKPIQQKLWDKVPDARYVTPPNKGSMHNRGLAVDLTLVDSKGKELDMGTPYDFFGEKAYPAYTNLPEPVLLRRKLLASIMMKYGFKPIRTEWWHFSYPGQPYPISEMVWLCN